jgi:SAM-dependent methyltransferase
MSAAEAHLRRFHARWPGATSRSLAAGRLADGRSSYDLLADLARPGDRVLDLGCGDGWLLELLARRGHGAGRLCGLDLSADELAVARRRPALSGAALVLGRAQAAPLGDGAVDLVVSHLAFTLMAELDDVVAEVARLLAPGGRFAAIVGGGPKRDDAFARFAALGPVAGGDGPPVRLGDRRARSDDGLAALFGAARGFAGLDIVDHELTLDASPAEVWQRLGPSYEMAAATDDRLAAARAVFLAAVAPLVRPDGTVPCAMALRLVRARRP